MAPCGAAALTVVMVLFFIVALVAAYTSRNLIFEQRTSANLYRSTQAFEAADAGLEWALAMLNSGRIDANCAPHTTPSTDTTFRQRYLDLDPSSGTVAVRTRSDGQPLRAACVFDGTGWQCSCPADAAPSLADPTGAGPHPAFVVRFYENNPAFPTGSPPYPPGVVRVEATGCTRLDATDVCASTTGAGDGQARVTILAALKSALVTPPAAAVTVGQSFAHVSSGTTGLVNADPESALTLHFGTAYSFTGTHDLAGPAGTPGGSTTVAGPDASMASLTANEMFVSVFGMDRDTYRLQPAAIRLDCTSGCTASTVADVAGLNPGRVLWLAGDLAADGTAIGSTTEPVVLIVDGTIGGAGSLDVAGVVYQTGTSWAQSGDLTLTGALVGESSLSRTASGSSVFSFDRAIINRLHWTSGSFVRVPGSWRDF